jgi:hypothetical protein
MYINKDQEFCKVNGKQTLWEILMWNCETETTYMYQQQALNKQANSQRYHSRDLIRETHWETIPQPSFVQKFLKEHLWNILNQWWYLLGLAHFLSPLVTLSL